MTPKMTPTEINRRDVAIAEYARYVRGIRANWDFAEQAGRPPGDRLIFNRARQEWERSFGQSPPLLVAQALWGATIDAH